MEDANNPQERLIMVGIIDIKALPLPASCSPSVANEIYKNKGLYTQPRKKNIAMGLRFKQKIRMRL
jgi:hypothetical protein